MVTGAVAPRRLELQHRLPGAVHTQPLIGNCRTSDIAAQLLQPLPVIGCDAYAGMQAETVGVGAERRRGFSTSRQMARCQLQAQHLLPRTRALRDAVVGSGGLQGGHHVIRIGDATSQIGLAILFNKVTQPCQQPQNACDDLAQ